MCGLIARFGPPCDPGELRARIEAGLDAMSHRGPDGRGIWLRDGIALGHVRLAVTDLAGGAQPIANEDGSIVAIVNGELYNNCRADLIARGHRFRTASDSELLVHLYEEKREQLTDELRGEFAFVLWDGNARDLIAGRDRFGIKPLFVSRHDDAWWFASEAKALFAAGVPAAWSIDGIRQALAHQYLAPRQTLFHRVFEMPPGGHVWANLRRKSIGIGDPTALASPEGVGDREAVAGIRRALEDAVTDRLRADVPIAAYLSGGLDSSLVSALAARHAPITAFGIAFDHADYDEHDDAAAFARELGVPFHAVRVSQHAILETLPEAVYRSEGLCINGQLPAKFLLSRAVRDAGFKVVLAGEGADEVFYGYAHLVRDYLELAAARGDRDAAAQLSEHDPATSQQSGVMLPLERSNGLPTWLDAKREIGERMRPLLAPLGMPIGDPIAQLLDAIKTEASSSPLGRFVGDPSAAIGCDSDMSVARTACVRSTDASESHPDARERTTIEITACAGGPVSARGAASSGTSKSDASRYDPVRRSDDAAGVVAPISTSQSDRASTSGPVRRSVDLVARSADLWTRLALARYILRTLGDGTEMAHSVEGRLPYLDARVVAAARRATTEQHLRGGVAKRLLREAARGILPERICARPKRPLLAPPITQSLSRRSADLIRDVVRGSSLPAFFDRDRVIAWVDTLPSLAPADARAAEPLLMPILSACALQQRFRLGTP